MRIAGVMFVELEAVAVERLVGDELPACTGKRLQPVVEKEPFMLAVDLKVAGRDEARRGVGRGTNAPNKPNCPKRGTEAVSGGAKRGAKAWRERSYG